MLERLKNLLRPKPADPASDAPERAPEGPVTIPAGPPSSGPVPAAPVNPPVDDER